MANHVAGQPTNPKHLALNRARAQRYKAQGLCVTCGLERDGNSTVRCTICLEKGNELRRARLGQRSWWETGLGMRPVNAPVGVTA